MGVMQTSTLREQQWWCACVPCIVILVLSPGWQTPAIKTNEQNGASIEYILKMEIKCLENT